MNPLNFNDLKELQTCCEQQDRIHLKLNWDMLLNPEEENSLHLAEYRDGRLIAFLGKYIIGGNLEICGMVHPDFRRQGFFAKLLKEGLNEQEVARYRMILLNTPAASTTGKAFLGTVNCRYSFSEYQMQYVAAENRLGTVRQDVSLRPAVPEDTAFLSRLDADGFQCDYQETLQEYARLSPAELAENEVVVVNGTDVGKIRLSRIEDRSWIYGFVTRSDHRGGGIGSAVLKQVIDREQAAGRSIWLDVAIENPAAMKLYTTAGFETRSAQDYYTYEI